MTLSIANLFKVKEIRTKILITVIGAGFAVLGGSTYLSFTYWQKEARFVAEQQALLAAQSAWKYLKGTNAPSTPVTEWRQPAFSDTTWSTGTLPIGYRWRHALWSRSAAANAAYAGS